MAFAPLRRSPVEADGPRPRGVGRPQVQELLKDHGADVAAREKDNITALMEAALAGHGDVVDVLIDADGGALVGATSNTGVSALWLAASAGKAAVVGALLRRGADVDNARSDGITALMAAASGGHVGAVEALAAAGANVALADRDGLTQGSKRVRRWPTSNRSSLGRFPLVLADFWTSDRLSERSRSMDVGSRTRARGPAKVEATSSHPFAAQASRRS